MKNKKKWAIIMTFTIIVSLAMMSSPVTACWSQNTSCEGESVHQGDGGATDYWYDHLYPPEHYLDSGTSTEWIIKVQGGYGCSDYEHCTVTDNTPPSGWSTTIEMGTIYTGSFHYIEPGNPAVNTGDDIEGREFYIGRTWNFDIIYRITAPSTSEGGESADMICEVYVVGYLPENQHDYVYVHCTAIINAAGPPSVTVTYPNGGERLSGTETISWDAIDPEGDTLSFDIFLSSDGGETYPDTLISGLGDVRSWSWDTNPYSDDIHYRIKIRGFDGSDYGRDFSDGDFSIDNVAPDPPSNLVIYFGLTTNGEPKAKASNDDTGSPLERIQKDDSRGYIVPKGMTLSMETFNTYTQNDPVESAILNVEYWVENTDYSGESEVMWKLETDSIFQSTGIKPLSTENIPVVKSFDLFANGVDTLDKITNLDIQFFNDDGGSAQNVSFDYIWVTVKASSNDLGLTWDLSPSPDIDHYHVYRSTDGVSYSNARCSSYLFWNDAGKGTDLNNYFYKIRALDWGGKESSSTYVVSKQVIPLSENWNLVSTPLIQQGDDSLDAVLESVDGNYDTVMAYKIGYSKPWLHWHSSKPSVLNDLMDMNHKEGYYILMRTSDNFMTIGKLPGEEVIPLKAGWNLIGYPSLESKPRDEALSSISGKYSAVYGFDPATGKEVEVQASDHMGPGNGYWIYVSQDCVLSMSPS